VAARAFGGERPVDDWRAARSGVTAIARYRGVGAAEREARVPVVVEAGRRPEAVEPVAGVAVAAVGPGGELGPVRVAVAGGAGALGGGVVHRGPMSRERDERRAWRPSRPALLVTGRAGDGAVCALEREAEARVRGHRDGAGREPIAVVALEAVGRGPPLVGIDVTIGAAALRQHDGDLRLAQRTAGREGTESLPFGAVAGGAFHGRVAAGEGESGTRVPPAVERRRGPAGHRMTPPALGAARTAGELAAVIVGMTVRAPGRERPHDGAPAAGAGGVARPAPHIAVAAFQGVAGLAVAGDGVRGRGEAGETMAGGAVGRFAAQGRRAGVGIAMAPRAGGKGRAAARGGAEVVTPLAPDGGVPALEGVAGAGVVERLAVDRVEPSGEVAIGARLAEPAAVRVGMTVGAFAMGQVAVYRNGVTRRGAPGGKPGIQVACVACDPDVPAGQGIIGGVVREPGRRGPLPLIVALEAVGRQRAAMQVRVAGGAGALQSDPSRGAGLAGREGGSRGALVLGRVTVVAPQPPVALLQRPAGASVVESLR